MKKVFIILAIVVLTSTLLVSFTACQPVELDFNSAIEAYKQRDGLYLSLTMEKDGEKSTMEYYESTDKLIVTNPYPSAIYYFDKNTNKCYYVDKTLKKNTSVELNIDYLYRYMPKINGMGTASSITIDSKSYECMDFVADNDVTVRFVKENDQVQYIVISNSEGKQTIMYSDIKIHSKIPQTSKLNGVEKFETTNWIVACLITPSMSPALEMNKFYYFEKVDVATLVVGDIVMAKSGDNTICHRIVEIVNEDNKLVFILKGDNNNVADIPYESEDIIGKLVTTTKE